MITREEIPRYNCEEGRHEWEYKEMVLIRTRWWIGQIVIWTSDSWKEKSICKQCGIVRRDNPPPVTDL